MYTQSYKITSKYYVKTYFKRICVMVRTIYSPYMLKPASYRDTACVSDAYSHTHIYIYIYKLYDIYIYYIYIL